MLEKLAHWNGIVPDNQHFVKVTIPRGTSYEVATSDAMPGWDSQMNAASRCRPWAAVPGTSEKRSAILLVPSLVARMERNVIINSHHPEFENMEVSLETPVWWDRRLFLTTA